MWTDGRYFLQAEKQLENGWKMKKMDVGVPPYYEEAVQLLGSGKKIGFDPAMIPTCTFF